MSNVKQQTLGNTATKTEDEKSQLDEKLADADITESRRDAIVDKFGSLGELLNATDVAITNTNNIGKTTLEKIRQHIDPEYGEDYTVKESGDGFVVAEWTEEANEREDILAGEYILSQLKTEQHFGHHTEVQKRLFDWAKEKKQSNTDIIADELLTAVRSITATEINQNNLFDITKSYDDPTELKSDKKEAVLKARGLMAYCDTTTKIKLLGKAETTAKETLEEKKEEKHEQQQKEKMANQLLTNPPETIGEWEHKETPKEGIIAYQGTFNGDESIITLFEDDEHVRIRVFPTENWNEIDWSTDNVEQHMYDDVYSIPTGETPNTMEEGAEDLIDRLR